MGDCPMEESGRRSRLPAGYLAVTTLLCVGLGSAQTSMTSTELVRPADLELWPSVGTTVRMRVDGMAEKLPPGAPAQVRLVRMAPDDYAAFLRSGEYRDGSVLAASLYALTTSATTTADVFGTSREVALVAEVLDRSHPDARRFYVFAPGAARATALPPGNDCAECHRENGHFDGTFSLFYPLIARRVSAGRSHETP